MSARPFALVTLAASLALAACLPKLTFGPADARADSRATDAHSDPSDLDGPSDADGIDATTRDAKPVDAPAADASLPDTGPHPCTAAPGAPFGFARIAVGDFHSCAVTRTGLLYCWGQNASGQLGTDGTILCWGRNDFGQCVGNTGAGRIVAPQIVGGFTP